MKPLHGEVLQEFVKAEFFFSGFIQQFLSNRRDVVFGQIFLLGKISPSTGVAYSLELRPELARKLSAADQRSSSSCLS